MLRRKVGFGILIVLGFALVASLYLLVMSGTAEIFGTVRVESQLVSWDENPPGLEDTEMVSVNGYCMKGPNADNRMLLSTKNKHKTDKMKYSFVAKKGTRHLILVYLQMDHLTGDVGQDLELDFMTNIIKKKDLERNFAIAFVEIEGVKGLTVDVTGKDLEKPIHLEYPISDIPEVIELQTHK